MTISWVNKDTEIYCSFAKDADNIDCQMMNSAFYYYGLNKIYKSFSVNNIESAVNAVKTLNIKGFAITMPYKKQILKYVDEIDESAKIGAANTVINNKGNLTAYNTEWMVALKCLDKYNPCGCDEDDSKKLPQQLYILGNGGYATAVKAAANDLDMPYVNITRNNWGSISNIKNSIIYNCTPVTDIQVDSSNTFIDCIVTTEIGYKLATAQAAHQFKLYTQQEFPWKNL